MGKRRFAATVKADEHKTSTGRFANNNLTCHIRGWDIGLEITAYVDPQGNDAFRIAVTGGSNRPTPRDTIGHLWLEDGRQEYRGTERFEYAS